MKIEILQDGSSINMIVHGRLDTLAAPEFDSMIEPYLTLPDLKITVDVTDMDYVSSSGLRSFIKLLKKVNANDGQMAIEGMSSTVKEIFDMTGFSSLFLMLPSVADTQDRVDDFRYYFLGKKL